VVPVVSQQGAGSDTEMVPESHDEMARVGIPDTACHLADSHVCAFEQRTCFFHSMGAQGLEGGAAEHLTEAFLELELVYTDRTREFLYGRRLFIIQKQKAFGFIQTFHITTAQRYAGRLCPSLHTMQSGGDKLQRLALQKELAAMVAVTAIHHLLCNELRLGRRSETIDEIALIFFLQSLDQRGVFPFILNHFEQYSAIQYDADATKEDAPLDAAVAFTPIVHMNEIGGLVDGILRQWPASVVGKFHLTGEHDTDADGAVSYAEREIDIPVAEHGPLKYRYAIPRMFQPYILTAKSITQTNRILPGHSMVILHCKMLPVTEFQSVVLH